MIMTKLLLIKETTKKSVKNHFVFKRPVCASDCLLNILHKYRMLINVTSPFPRCVCRVCADGWTIIIIMQYKKGDVLISTHTNYSRKTTTKNLLKTDSKDDDSSNNKNKKYIVVHHTNSGGKN